MSKPFLNIVYMRQNVFICLFLRSFNTTYFIPYSLFMDLDTIEGLTFMCPILPLVSTYGK